MERCDFRILEMANFIVDNNATIRQTAKKFNMAKSTVHYYITKRLSNIDIELYKKVKKILKINFQEKNIRGGEATKLMYLKRKNQK